MFLNFWYPLTFGEEVRRKPQLVTALGRPLVVWRTRHGTVSVLSNVCVHRGGSLAAGKVTDQGITCPYHGWAYRSDGSCALIPAQPDRNIPARARVDSYPVAERYGIVWAFLGDLPEAERPPLPDWPEFAEPGWARIHGRFTWRAGLDRVVEGGLDFAHGPFVHEGTFGRGMDPRVADFDVEVGDWSASASDDGLGGLGWHLPGSTRTELVFGTRRQLILQAHLPVDEHETLTLYVIQRNFGRTPLVDPAFRLANLRVLREDRRVVENLRPELLPYRMGDELHVRADALQVAFRRRRKELIDSGWPTLGSPQDTGARTVIGSPARREPALSRAWVHRSDT